MSASAIDNHPDQIDFMRLLTILPTQTLIRAIVCGHPDERRQMRAGRYLDRRANGKDAGLAERMQAGTASDGHTVGLPGKDEAGARRFARHVGAGTPRSRLPRGLELLPS